MRLTLRFKSLKTVSQKENSGKYFVSMNSWIYSKLNNAELHDSKSFKYFSFSNLIGVRDSKIEKDKIYKTTISFAKIKTSIDFIRSLELDEIVNLGEFHFKLIGFYSYNINLKKNSIIETPTIISITKHDDSKIIALDYLDSLQRDKYVALLSKNLIRKYNSFTNESVSEDFELFKNVKIIPIYNKHKMNKFCIPLGSQQNNNFVIGNKLKFEFNEIDDLQLKIFNVAFDAGFGIKNTYGIGFMIEKRGNFYD